MFCDRRRWSHQVVHINGGKKTPAVSMLNGFLMIYLQMEWRDLHWSLTWWTCWALQFYKNSDANITLKLWTKWGIGFLRTCCVNLFIKKGCTWNISSICIFHVNRIYNRRCILLLSQTFPLNCLLRFRMFLSLDLRARWIFFAFHSSIFCR